MRGPNAGSSTGGSRTSSPTTTRATDIWTRALPALTLLFLVELVALAPNRDFPLWLNVLVVAAIFAVGARRWALVNRGARRRALARPDDIGPIEIAAFVVVPAIVPLVLGGQVRQAIAHRDRSTSCCSARSTSSTSYGAASR